ncbi:MAG: carbamoyl-phosphate synthase large subunit, partial [Oscillospiraceae bacterium]|nr:carbamoyl-phosphate synthase large subunit [Oscillospiraceae bacterium]
FSGETIKERRMASYKTVDTCAAEFEAYTPYYYSTYDDETEAVKSDKKRVLVIGSGPIRIGQGIEFDYCTVHSVWALREAGYEAIIANNNPETVSTDFDTSDRLYFDPLTPDDIDNVIAAENPDGVIVQFGGQTAIKLAKHFSEKGIKILGTSFEMIDAAEDRKVFDAILEKCEIPRPEGMSVFTTSGAVSVAEKIGFPVLLRPSYVLGGQNMVIAYNVAEVTQYMDIITRAGIENPVLIDKYIMGREIEVDAICDGTDILVPGIMEHIERAGVHSGDSISMYPSQNVCDHHKKVIIEYTKRLAKEMKVVGMMNVQYVLMGDTVYVIEVNPRSSRTVPYISKVTGIPVVKLATRCMLGEKLKNLGYGTGLYPDTGYIAVKVPVFSFEKIHNIDVQLGPEMKSTGEALGIARTLRDALQKGLTAAGFKMKHQGRVLLTIRDRDKQEVLPIAKRLAALGFNLYATGGTKAFLNENGLVAEYVGKIHQGGTIIELIESGIDYVISTSEGNRAPERDSVKIRRKAVECRIPCLTSIDTARALCDSLENFKDTHELAMVNIADLNKKIEIGKDNCRSGLPMQSVVKGKKPLKFTKMHGIGNDYIYFNCIEQTIDNPNQLSLTLSDRHFGVGGDGIVMIMPSDIADFRMRMFNTDGSEGKMCGNASRCVGKYVYERGLTTKTTVTLETLSGTKVLNLKVVDGVVEKVTVDMGVAELNSKKVPVCIDKEKVIGETVTIDDKEWNITCVSMGNPHCVVFYDDVENMPLSDIGPKFEFASIFPDRINTEFVEVIDSTTLKMRVWERGSGETMACGTGACATVVAAVENGISPRNTDITVELLGGNLTIKYMTDGTVFMTGGASFVFDGQLL